MHLALHLLGPPLIQLNNKPINFDRRKAIALVAYLATNDIGHIRRNYSRELLSDLFWPEYDQARAFAYLRRTLWEVNQTIGQQWLNSDKGTISLSPDADFWLDVVHFQDLLQKARQKSDAALRIALLVDTVKLYRNHFLTGFSLKDSPDFNQWAYAQSETLRDDLGSVLNMLIQDHCDLGQPESAIPHARRLISLDPLNETAHRQLMDVYLQAGQHPAALQQYQTCEKVLRKELGIDPQPETRALYKKIRKGEVKSTQPVGQKITVTPPHNLPLQLTTFIGREKERDEIIGLLEKNRLVTLTGVGGIGKTRLSLQVGENILNYFSDGVWIVALDSLTDPTLLSHTIASVFDIREGSNQDILKRLMNALYAKSTLLILDNCEHLLPNCAHLSEALLKNCPHLKILATSREILGAAGEVNYTVPSLSIPKDQHDVTENLLSVYESIRLFQERAAMTLPSFTLTIEEALAVTNICRRLDGIPLAVELAAARVDILQVDEILEQLNHCFDLLISNTRTAIPRHQTMRASMDWSWGLLTETEQTFMKQLSVFAGGWTLDSAKAVCDGDVLNLTSALVKKSLIVVNQEAGRETRYRFHEIVRQYAHEKLSETGTEQDIHNRHLGYFLNFSEQAETTLKGPAQVEWTNRLEDESDNFRVALDWAIRNDVEAGSYLSARLHNFKVNFDFRESARWLVEFLQSPESSAYPTARAKALYAYGDILILTQQFDLARASVEEGLALDRSTRNKYGEVDGLILLALIMVNLGDFEKEQQLRRQALRLARSLADQWRTALALAWLGLTNRNYQQDRGYLQESIDMFRSMGDLNNLTRFLGHLGRNEMLNGDFESAQVRLEEAISLIREMNRKSISFSVWRAYGQMALLHGNYGRAYTAMQEALQYADKTGERMAVLWFSADLGYVTLKQGNTIETRGHFTKCLKEFLNDQVEIGIVFAIEGMTGLYIILNKPERAARLIGWADSMRKKLNDIRPPLEQAAIDQNIAACLIKMGEVIFSDAYDEGEKLTLEEAVAYALEDS